MNGQFKMKTYTIKDCISGQLFKVILSEEEFQNYLDNNQDILEIVECKEYDDCPSILIE